MPRYDHYWTAFEEHTLVCLMARGAHLELPGNRNLPLEERQHNAKVDIATRLNSILHGEKNYSMDIPMNQVLKKINYYLNDKMSTFGEGGYLERVKCGRITRTLRQINNRSDLRAFNGSLKEWRQGRREEVLEGQVLVTYEGSPFERGRHLLRPGVSSSRTGQQRGGVLQDAQMFERNVATANNSSADVSLKHSSSFNTYPSAPRTTTMSLGPHMDVDLNHDSYSASKVHASRRQNIAAHQINDNTSDGVSHQYRGPFNHDTSRYRVHDFSGSVPSHVPHPLPVKPVISRSKDANSGEQQSRAGNRPVENHDIHGVTASDDLFGEMAHDLSTERGLS